MHLETERDSDGGWYDREVKLVDEDGAVREEFGKDPLLGELREAERLHGQRINLWQQGLVCHECSNQINDRFSTDEEGHLLCWDCATTADHTERGSLRMGVDTTKSVLSQSKLFKKSLCDYVVNVATGCRHGCKFCYVPSTPAIDSRDEYLQSQAGVEDPQAEWGQYVLYRDDLPERVHQGLQKRPPETWETTDRGRGIVMLSSGTDCYQDRRAAQITRGVVDELTSAGASVRILTRSPNITRDFDLFQRAGDTVSIGTSIPSFDTALVKAIEPNAPPPQARWEVLDQAFRHDIRRFVSFSPTYPTMDRDDIREALNWFRAIDPEVVFHEPINPRGMNFELCVDALRGAGFEAAASAFEELLDRETWVEYALEQIQMVRDVAAELGGPTIHTWPDRELIGSTSGETREQLVRMKTEISGEDW